MTNIGRHHRDALAPTHIYPGCHTPHERCSRAPRSFLCIISSHLQHRGEKMQNVVTFFVDERTRRPLATPAREDSNAHPLALTTSAPPRPVARRHLCANIINLLRVSHHPPLVPRRCVHAAMQRRDADATAARPHRHRHRHHRHHRLIPVPASSPTSPRVLVLWFYRPLPQIGRLRALTTNTNQQSSIHQPYQLPPSTTIHHQLPPTTTNHQPSPTAASRRLSSRWCIRFSCLPYRSHPRNTSPRCAGLIFAFPSEQRVP